MNEIISTSSPIIITHNGEAKIIIQDVKVYEEQKEALTLLKILCQSTESLKKGNYKPLRNSFDSVKKKLEKANEKL